MRVVVRRILLIMMMGILPGLLAACGDGEPRLGHEVHMEGNGRLLCSQACSQRGQCGHNENWQEFVLGHRDFPATQNHNVLLPVGDLVTVNWAEERQVEPVQGGEPFILRFYHVTTVDQIGGWVAGWCLAAP
jgi:hypothetical protein